MSPALPLSTPPAGRPSAADSVSVALATCNGARFLEEQLTSIAAQRRLPDELVVVDDASEDGTWALVQSLARRLPFPVRSWRQPSRVGVARNFSTALERCAGTLIATCDQDDRWHPDRLAVACEAMADPDVLLVCSDAQLIDAAGAPTGVRLWAHAGIPARVLRALAGPDPLAVLLGRRVVTGATMTVRAELVRAALPIGPGWIHDEWLSAQAALRGGRIAVRSEPLVEYRQHTQNAVGASADGLWRRGREALRGDRRARVRRQLEQWEALATAIETDDRVAAVAKARLAARIAHLARRAALPPEPFGRAMLVLRELRAGGYRSGAMGGWSAVQDLLG